MLDLRRVMDFLYENGKRIFFIDEITMINDLQAYGNVLSEYYVMIGAKVVIAGTDSFGIYMAKTDILYDRVVLLHTSQIPYAEFHRICEEDFKRKKALTYIHIVFIISRYIIKTQMRSSRRKRCFSESCRQV